MRGQSWAAVGRFRHNCTYRKREFAMTTVGILIWFIVLMIGFFIGVKVGAA